MGVQHYRQACVFGGTGFIGQQIVQALARDGYRIKVATRVPERAYFLRPFGHTGQIVPFACDYASDAGLREAIQGCDVVVNTVGILYERRRDQFAQVHTDLPRRIAQICAAEKVARLIHISALGCDRSNARYAQSKLAGEQAVFEHYPSATILRPGVVFGAGDNFFNMFAKLSLVLPALPLIGGGKTRFQPVYVGDVVQAVIAAVKRPDSAGQIYELGGPDTLTFRAILERLAKETGRKPVLLPVPWPVARVQGAGLGLLPSPLLTADQVESLKTDNVVTGEKPGLSDLDVQPTGLDAVLPTYLARYRPGGRFGDKKRA